MISIIPIGGVGDVAAGDDVAGLLHDAFTAEGDRWLDGDVLVVTHKVVSKAEGRVAPAPDDATYRALVASEAAAVLRRRGDLAITKTAHGFICANAGVDRSNVVPGTAVLLPIDPDRSAHGIRMKIRQWSSVDLGVIISDTFGRAWRTGLSDVAIGVSGVRAVDDLRGTADMYGRTLDVTEVALADEIAAAADLAMGKAAGIPAAVVRGVNAAGGGRAQDLVRSPSDDLFR